MANPLLLAAASRLPVAGQAIRGAGCLIALLVAVAAITVFGAVALMLSSITSSGENGTSSASGICSPGDADDSAVEIPEEYREHVEDAASTSGFSVELIAAQIYHESTWDETATSGQANGIAQFTPDTWAEYGNGGDVWDPEDAIDAQGRYMADMRAQYQDVADDEEHLTELALAGYNAGGAMPGMTDYDLSEDTLISEFGSQHDYVVQTYPYVQNIMAAADGAYSSDCSHSGDVPTGDVVEASRHLAWEERVELEFSRADDHGRDASKPEYVDVADSLPNDRSLAYYTDCGAFVASVMISSGVDPDYPPRGTSIQYEYLQNSDDYEFFVPSSTDELEPGDILIATGSGMGHTYIYTGERHASEEDGHAQGASLYTRPPSGHYLLLTDNVGTYTVARHTGGN